MTPKKVVTAILVVFSLVSIGTIVVRELLPTTAEKKQVEAPQSIEVGTKAVVYYFHGNQRCKTCKTIEAYTREAVAQMGTSTAIEIKAINVEDSNNEHFIQDYKLSNRSVVLSRVENNKEIKWSRLDKVWQLVGDKVSFLNYVKDQMTSLMEVN